MKRPQRLAGERGRARVPVYLQVNVDDDPAKAGFAPDALEGALEGVLALREKRPVEAIDALKGAISLADLWLVRCTLGEAYLAAGLPTLPFEAESFDLVLCGEGVIPMLLLERGRAD